MLSREAIPPSLTLLHDSDGDHAADIIRRVEDYESSDRLFQLQACLLAHEYT